MYMSDLRNIYDPVLSSLKVEGIRLLFLFGMYEVVFLARYGQQLAGGCSGGGIWLLL
jgi:hypothetical protein